MFFNIQLSKKEKNKSKFSLIFNIILKTLYLGVLRFKKPRFLTLKLFLRKYATISREKELLHKDPISRGLRLRAKESLTASIHYIKTRFQGD